MILPPPTLLPLAAALEGITSLKPEPIEEKTTNNREAQLKWFTEHCAFIPTRANNIDHTILLRT